MSENRNLWIGIVIVVVILLIACVCCIGGGAAFLWFSRNNPSIPTPPPIEWPGIPVEPITPNEPDTPVTPDLPPSTAPVPDEAAETLAALQEAQIPDSDYHELGIRFLGVPADTPRTLSAPNPDYALGTRRQFRVSNVDNDEQFDIYAKLVYKTDHVYMWVEEGVSVDNDKLQEAANLFEEHTYPTNREFFGSEWTPGVDNDPHLSILHARGLGDTVAGYFSSPDSYVRAVRSDSNEMEMFYINVENVDIGDEFYNGVLAHEFQHMIHWYNDRNEDTWLNEGCSELAMELNNRAYPGGHYDVGGSEYAYLRIPDTQLTNWPEGTAGDASPNYGGAYLFMSYFLNQFGEDATKALVNHTENGMKSVDTVLAENLGLPLTHEDIFANWIVANLLDDTSLDSGQYGYADIDFNTPRMDTTYRLKTAPITDRSTVSQYGVDYIKVQSKSPVRFTFTGSTQTALMNTQAHSGQYLWWSNRADESDPRLTRLVDLSNATAAELRFWSWYSIEEDWDYAYVVVGTTATGVIPEDINSTDIHWEILDAPGLGCRSENPNGNNFGCGLTGKSEDWVRLNADLSAYAGQEIALRFEYITDAAVNQAGFAVDDVELIVDGQTLFSDDIEGGDGDWIAEGFVRHANVLPQEWIVQLVTYGDTPQVEQLLMLDGTSGEWTIPMSNQQNEAVIAISALAPVTTEEATYEILLELAED
ncbi:MAG TPA: immune inhibitor A [Anaerolineae bacterium]|nr:immune inhibitor A [Anaerolineae bacterium]HQH39298.1 immune inhibitor A [Anaerolineae bacterium]